MKELVTIQSELKAPKNQRNTFGGYNYRSAEDILEAVKPLLKKEKCTLTISDEIVQVGDRIYIKSTATLTNEKGESTQTSAFAREPLSKKGQDESQVTGSASSYARKYALNGLFCIDDNKDADTLNVSKEYTQPVAVQPSSPTPSMESIKAELAACKDTQSLLVVWNKYPSMQKNAEFTGAMTARKDQILKNGKS